MGGKQAARFYGDLPIRVQDFKSEWMAKFPNTIDTKHIVETHEVFSSMPAPATLKGLQFSLITYT